MSEKTRLSLQTRLHLALGYRDYIRGHSNTSIKRLITRNRTRICSKHAPRKLYEKLMATGSVSDLKRSGRPKTNGLFSSMKQLKINMVSEIRNNRYSTSRQLGRKLGISKTVANTIRKNMGFIGSITKTRPQLTELHMKQRLVWAKKNKNRKWDNVVDFDFWWCRSGRAIKKKYFRKNSPRQRKKVKSRNFQTKVMFGGAVSRKFGQIGLYECFQWKTAVRNSKYHRRGDEYKINKEIDGEYCAEILDMVAKDIEKKFKKGVVVLQMDNATVHQFCEEYMKKYNNKRRKVRIKYEFQPKLSPDLNAMDLGVWKTLADAVELCEPVTRDDVINAAFSSFKNISLRNIRSIISRKNDVCELIIEHNGDNDFDI